MKTQTTLKELLRSRKEELSQKLAEYYLPKDAPLVLSTVENHLNELLNSEGEFRQSLTQSEDYILQAALSLLNAQQSMMGEFAAIGAKCNTEEKTSSPKTNAVLPNKKASVIEKEKFPYVIGGSAVGSAVGSLMLGTWGAVFGAIAGTALLLYYSSNQGLSAKRAAISSIPSTQKSASKQEKIDVEVFVGIVENICDNVDMLIQTFRAQVNRVVDKYESMEKPVLEKEYRFLIENIQTLVGYKRTHSEDEKYLSKLQLRIEDLTETLENYGLSVEDYTEEHRSWFEMVESPKAQADQMVYPAIVKNGQVVLQGKVFIPENKNN